MFKYRPTWFAIASTASGVFIAAAVFFVLWPPTLADLNEQRIKDGMNPIEIAYWVRVLIAIVSTLAVALPLCIWKALLINSEKLELATEVDSLKKKITPTLEDRIRQWLYYAKISHQRAPHNEFDFVVKCTLESGRELFFIRTEKESSILVLYVHLFLKRDDAQRFHALTQERQMVLIQSLGSEFASSDLGYGIFKLNPGAVITIEHEVDTTTLGEVEFFKGVNQLANLANHLDFIASRKLDELEAEKTRDAKPSTPHTSTASQHTDQPEHSGESAHES